MADSISLALDGILEANPLPPLFRAVNRQDVIELANLMKAKLDTTIKSLNVLPHEARILLIKYGWDVEELISDYRKFAKIDCLLENVVEESRLDPSQYVECPVCYFTHQCVTLNCGHTACFDCLRNSAKSIYLLCPVHGCKIHLNVKDLVQDDMLSDYICILLLDLQEKIKKSVFDDLKETKVARFVLENKKILVGLFAVVVCGYTFYKVRKWETDNPGKTFLIKSGYFVHKKIEEFNEVAEKAWNSA